MAGEAEDDFTADWLRSKDAAEKSNVGLEKVSAVYFQLQPDGSEPGMSGIVIGKKMNGTGRDGTGRNGIERDGVKL